jgi:hypothetical protein
MAEERCGLSRLHRDPIAVMVRVVFERDGETWIEGSAMRWDRTRVCVTVNDVLLSSGYVWVRARDVRRLGTQAPPPR